VNKSVFGRGFEAFGKPIPIRGTVPAAPIPVAQVAAPAPRPSLAVPKQAVTRTMRGAAVPVYQKGDPNAPPCPVCG